MSLLWFCIGLFLGGAIGLILIGILSSKRLNDLQDVIIFLRGEVEKLSRKGVGKL